MVREEVIRAYTDRGYRVVVMGPGATAQDLRREVTKATLHSGISVIIIENLNCIAMKKNTLYLVTCNHHGHDFPTDGTGLVEMTNNERNTRRLDPDDGYEFTNGKDTWWLTPEEIVEVGDIGEEN